MIRFARRLWCGLFGHAWQHRPAAPPEDRVTSRCERCGRWGYHPSRVGEASAPAVRVVNDD